MSCTDGCKGIKSTQWLLTTQIDKSRMMGTAAFKKEINHLLYSNSYTGSDGEFDAGWNCRDHSLVMALMLKSGDNYPKIASGKCMFVQGPVAGNAAFGIGQEDYYKSGHNWLVHSKFGLIDVSPLFVSQKRIGSGNPFNGIFNRVWLPPGKERVSVVLCHDPHDYAKGNRKRPGARWPIQPLCICHLDDQEVTDKLIEEPLQIPEFPVLDRDKAAFWFRFLSCCGKAPA